MKEVKRVLQVMTIMNRGGEETMIMNHYRVIDRSRVQFDFLVHREERGAYDDEIEALGGRIIRTMPIRPWSYYSYFRWLDSFFKDHAIDYVAVHSHIQENSGFVFKYAQKYGLKNCIANSHIAFIGWDAKVLFRKFARIYLEKYTTQRIACGEDAGKYLFGTKEYEVFRNAIDVTAYRYNADTRSKIRKELGIDSKFVLGSVARLTWQKNHTFMLDVMSELVKVNKNAVLLLVGNGDLENEVREKIDKLNLQDHVIMLGVKDNVNELLQSFDVFFMPSLFEGLPVSVIEAQAAGLPCLLSSTIDKTVDVTGNVLFEDLKAPVSSWIKRSECLSGFNREDTSSLIEKAGYSVEKNISRLYEIYNV